MSCYVDALQDWGKRWLYSSRQGGTIFAKSCHLIADTPEELHAMAKAIGLKREWMQPAKPGGIDHYDLTASRRKEAVRRGAIECDRATFVGHFRRLRAKPPAG